ncbi:hypothetical protein [Bacillus salipaludis]|uniref:Uncharacterized protein n=1 Tax=Bacillus salipaludis TaxID=2547811 RepID=A0ABW8RR05_9BACI
MKLRSWIFDADKEVTLKWLGNLTTGNNQWFIRAGFEYNNQIEFLKFPIAAFPLLKLEHSIEMGKY